MTDNYTPSTEEVRLAYAQNYVKTVEYHENGFAEFDRWYTAESARLRAEGAAEARGPVTDAAVEAAAEALLRHWLHDDTRNLGYYRTEARCECGALLWWGEHEGDPTYSMVWYKHLATAALEAARQSVTPVPTPEWEYATTTGPRKRWDAYDVPPEGDGWERDFSRGRDGDNWERFDYHEEAYWKRRVTPVPEEGTER